MVLARGIVRLIGAGILEYRYGSGKGCCVIDRCQHFGVQIWS